MTEICDLCRSPTLDKIYQPCQSGRGLKVYVCALCGLLQSLPRADRAPRADAAVSSGADWGNVRYGKAFRTEACLKRLSEHADLTRPLAVLDVGSNRGSFARALLACAPQARLTCVEPDERVSDSCRGVERVQLMRARIEDTKLPASHFDVIHSCHTIEHLSSPRAVLADHWRTLKPGGLLIVDAPNIAVIGAPDIVEEWFIDKHLYHFSAATLAALLEAGGFEIIAKPDASDRENLLFVAKKRVVPVRAVAPIPGETARATALVANYIATRAHNLTALEQVAAELKTLAPSRVAIWGAGRLFDALVLHGGFDPKLLVALVDMHLRQHVAERYGVPIVGPKSLAAADPQVIVVMSRAFAVEIARIAKLAVPKAEILIYGDLIQRARTQAAA